MGSQVSSVFQATGLTGPNTGASGSYAPAYLEPTGQLLAENLVSELQQPGLGGYSDYLQQIQQQRLLSPQGYQAYMSPYQQEIIQSTQDLLNQQRATGRQQIAQQAIQSGAFGGGREGVMRGVYESQRDLADAAALANLRQQGYTQATSLQQQGLGNLLAMANLPMQRIGTGIANLSALRAAVPTTTGAPQLTSPALAAAQAFGGLYSLLQPKQGGVTINMQNPTPPNNDIRMGDGDPRLTSTNTYGLPQILGPILGDVLGSIFS